MADTGHEETTVIRVDLYEGSLVSSSGGEDFVTDAQLGDAFTPESKLRGPYHMASVGNGKPASRCRPTYLPTHSALSPFIAPTVLSAS